MNFTNSFIELFLQFFPVSILNRNSLGVKMEMFDQIYI